MSNAFDYLDAAAILLTETRAHYGTETFCNAPRNERIAAMYNHRQEQTGVEDSFFYDESTKQLATVLYKDPIICAKHMVEMSIETNLACWDSVYPEDAEADARQKGMVMRLAEAAQGGTDVMPIGTPVTPPREALSNQLKTDLEKAYKQPGFLLYPREFASLDRGMAAMRHLHANRLLIFVENIEWFTLDKKTPAFGDKTFITTIKGSKGSVGIKLPFNLLTPQALDAANAIGQIPVTAAAAVSDPRKPIALTVGRDTKFKQAHYLRWLLTALQHTSRMHLLNEKHAEASAEMITLAKTLTTFSDEAALIKGENAEVNTGLATFNQPAQVENDGQLVETLEGSMADTLHRVLFNTFLEKQRQGTPGGSSAGADDPPIPEMLGIAMCAIAL